MSPHEGTLTPGDYKPDLRKAYDDRAEAYDHGNASYTSRYLSQVIGQFVHDIKRASGGRALDLGCGPGHDARRLQEHGLEVVGIDLSASMVRRARKKGIDAREMDFEQMTLAENSFDGVWSARSLVHLPKEHLPGVLQSVGRLLRPRGRFTLVVYEGEGEGLQTGDLDYYTARRFFAFYGRAELRALLDRTGFHVYREWRIRLGRPHQRDVLLAFASARM